MEEMKHLTPTTSRKSASELTDSELICIEESTSRYRIPVLSNRVLIRGGEARIFKTSSAMDFDNATEESVLEAVIYDTECNSDSLVCVLIKEDKRKDEKMGGKFPEHELVDVDSLKLEEDLYWDISSEDEEVKESESVDDTALPATLKMLEQVSFRILGEKTVTIPEIEKVEIQDKDEFLEKRPSSKQVVKEDDQLVEQFLVYLDTVEYSEKFVDSILQAAKQVCKSKHKMKLSLVGFKGFHRKKNVVWPSIKCFDVEAGIESIDMFIQHGFDLEEAWKYKISFLIAQSDKSSDFYMYEARFCIPTACYPIAQATVGVFFTFEVSRVVPKSFPVRVTFTLESLRTVMVPGEIEINDKSLLMVLYSKLAVYKKLFF